MMKKWNNKLDTLQNNIYIMEKIRKVIMMLLLSCAITNGKAQKVDAVTGATKQDVDTTHSTCSGQTGLSTDTTATDKVLGALSRLHLGGYGEAVMTRNFYSQSFNRYNAPERYKDDGSHGRFDLPHITFNLSYDFGGGWTLGSEVEFEHGGNETAVEIEAEESGEYEAETEKGGEVAIEQFWINKEFLKGKLNIKAGEIMNEGGKSDAYATVEKFRKLTKKQRDQIVYFIESI